MRNPITDNAKWALSAISILVAAVALWLATSSERDPVVRPSHGGPEREELPVISGAVQPTSPGGSGTSPWREEIDEAHTTPRAATVALHFEASYADGTPFSEASLSLVELPRDLASHSPDGGLPDEGGRLLEQGMTDALGRCIFKVSKDVDLDAIALRQSLVRRAPVQLSWIDREDPDFAAKAVVDAHPFSVRVIDDKGKPVYGARVHAQSLDLTHSDADGFRETRDVSEGGVTRFTVLKPKRLSITAVGPGGGGFGSISGFAVGFGSKNPEALVQLGSVENSAQLSVTLVAEDEIPFARGAFACQMLAPFECEPSLEAFGSPTSEPATLELPPGTYEIRVVPAYSEPISDYLISKGSRKTIKLEAGEPQRVDLTAGVGSRIEFEIGDSALLGGELSGSATPIGSPTSTKTESLRFIRPLGRGVSKSAQLSQAGRFLSQPLTPGDWDIEISTGDGVLVKKARCSLARGQRAFLSL